MCSQSYCRQSEAIHLSYITLKLMDVSFLTFQAPGYPSDPLMYYQVILVASFVYMKAIISGSLKHIRQSLWKGWIVTMKNKNFYIVCSFCTKNQKMFTNQYEEEFYVLCSSVSLWIFKLRLPEVVSVILTEQYVVNLEPWTLKAKS